MRRRLAGALARRPVPLPGRAGGWQTSADASDVAMYEASAEFREHRDLGADGWALAQLVRMVRDGIDLLRTPWSGTWQLEALARGRVRRWARWEVDGMAATQRAISTVSAALEAGRIAEPEGAVLVEVVDQRTAGIHRRSAGLGGARPAG